MSAISILNPKAEVVRASQALSVNISGNFKEWRLRKICLLYNETIIFGVVKCKPGGLDLSRRDLDRDLDLDAKKKSVSTVEKISTVFKS